MTKRKIFKAVCGIVFLYSAFSCSKDGSITPWNIGLNGRIKTITTFYTDSDTVGFSELSGTPKKIDFFDDNSQLLKSEDLIYDSALKEYQIESRTLFTYDNKHILQFQEIFDESGKTVLRLKFTKHLANGFPVQSELVTGDAVSTVKSVFSADSLVETSYDNEVLVDQRVVRYDKELKPFSESLTYFNTGDTDKITYNRTYKYFKFDERKNWLQRMVEEKGADPYYEIRKIEYWK